MNTPTEAGQVTTLDSLRRQTQAETNAPTVRTGFDSVQSWELMMRQCKALAASSLVPQQYQGDIPNCMIALEMSQRIGASPLMVMQNLYIVHGRPGWSAKFLIASFNQCGRFTALRFEWEGEKGKDTWGCRAWATEKSTGERIQGPLITMALARAEGWVEKSGSKWKTIPELMMTYRAAAWLVNTHAPEISMGLNTADELGDTYDTRETTDGMYVVDSPAELAKPEKKKAPESAAPPPPQPAESNSSDEAGTVEAADPPRRPGRPKKAPEKPQGTLEKRDELVTAINACTATDELDEIADGANLYQWSQADLAVINSAYRGRQEVLGQ